MLAESIPLLWWLTAIRPPSLHLLVLIHTSAQLNINPRRRRETKALGHLDQIKLADIEYTAQAVRRIRVQIGPITVLCGLVEVVILANELLELRLDVENFGGGKLKLHDGHAGCLEVGQEANLGRLQEHERAALAVGATGGTTDAVDVIAGVIRRVELDDPVHGGDLEVRVRQGLDRRGKRARYGNVHRDHALRRLCR